MNAAATSPPVVVTGAASGIGAATVARLTAAGRAVVGLDRKPARGCPTVLCDLARPETIDTAVAELPAELGGLANVAGLAWCLDHPLDAPSAYRFSKQVLIEWTLQASVAWRGSGVRVVSVSPGVVDTPILPDFRASMGDAAIDSATAEAGRLAEPDDIAPVIAFLLSDGARWVNGVDVRVDGGLVGGRLAIPAAEVGATPAR